MSSLGGGQSRCWCLTVNNTWSFDAINNFKNWSYIVAGREVALSGTKHLQAFIIFKTRTKFATVKNQCPRAHIERMMGTSEQAADYCKKDNDFEEWGEFESLVGGKAGASGGKAKAVNYAKIIKSAESHDFDEIKKDNPGVYFRHYHTIKRIAMDNPKPVEDLNELNNEWIWGKTGLGKSYNARKENPGIYIKSHNKWWLGYKGQKAILIDDISKTEAVWFGEHLKNWCDHYAYPAETKGDGMVMRPERIIVTSNYSIEDLWGHDENLCEAITRRFKIRHIVEPFPKVNAPFTPVKKEHMWIDASDEEDSFELPIGAKKVIEIEDSDSESFNNDDFLN